MRSAVDQWERQSNGMIEAKVFKFIESLTQEIITNTAFLRSLNLESIPIIQDDFSIVEINTSKTYASLYQSGLGGGYCSNKPHVARVKAWQSLAGLIGFPKLQTAEQIQHLAEKCFWFYFENSPWFFSVAWDKGIICLRENGKELAVLAATDTD